MRWPVPVALCAAATTALILAAQTPTKPGPAASKDAPKETLVVDARGFPPRSAPSDYSAHGQAGTVTVAAEFTGHNVATQEGLLTTEEFVVIEAGMFGPPDARLTLSIDDFSLRVNGAKKVLAREPYELVTKSLKDPDYEEPESNKSDKTVLNTGGKQDGTDPNAPPPALVPIPFEIRRGWQLRVKRDSMPIGDRPLPQAGLLFFPYSGATKGIRSLELMYAGPAGKVTLSLPHHP
jgi:hypothetical protein